ncbi:unnamed protein product, partial [Closterium sp. NIES-53]
SHPHALVAAQSRPFQICHSRPHASSSPPSLPLTPCTCLSLPMLLAPNPPLNPLKRSHPSSCSCYSCCSSCQAHSSRCCSLFPPTLSNPSLGSKFSLKLTEIHRHSNGRRPTLWLTCPFQHRKVRSSSLPQQR